MTNNTKLTILYYLFLLLLIVISPIIQGVNDYFTAFIFLTLTLTIFCIGNLTRKTVNRNTRLVDHSKLTFNENRLLFLSVLSLFFSHYAISFYTGKGAMDVLAALSLGVSNYNEYQSYFRDNNLAQFSLSKINGIFALLYVKFTLLILFSNVTIRGFSFKLSFGLLLSLLSMIYIAVGRGTSFEVFEVLLMIVFFTYQYTRIHNKRMSLKQIIMVCLILFLSILFYWQGVNARFSGEYIPQTVNEIAYDQDSFISSIPVLAKISFQLSNYFLVGPLYLSVFIESIFESSTNVFYFLLPMSELVNDISYKFLCNKDFDCGVAWTPSIEIIIFKLGMIGYFIFIYTLGVVDKYCSNSISKYPSTSYLLLSYFIFLNMISLPVGNFIGNSSSNILIIMIIISVKFFAVARTYLK